MQISKSRGPARREVSRLGHSFYVVSREKLAVWEGTGPTLRLEKSLDKNLIFHVVSGGHR